ncbi:MAG: Uma2 family endonuclease [Hormoscilla sp. GUM202]|nr:Uma2 family endonuclease [Hormoscilla sp. GUM202]
MYVPCQSRLCLGTRRTRISATIVTYQTTSDWVLLKNISWPTYVAMLAEMGRAEPDSGFYIQNEPLMRNKKELDLTKDPPPDLVLEVDYTSSVDRQIIYAALGVPELWRYEEQVA